MNLNQDVKHMLLTQKRVGQENDIDSLRAALRDKEAEIRGLKLTLAQIEMRTKPPAPDDTFDDLKRDLRHANSLARMGLKSPHP